MRQPEQFSSAVAIAFGVTSLVNLGVALLGYAIWGDGVAAVVIGAHCLLAKMSMTMLFRLKLTDAGTPREECAKIEKSDR